MIKLLFGDITNITCDAIVNAANSSLMGGGGVDGAIHKRGGHDILTECKAWIGKNGKLQTGEAMCTTAGNLPAKFVIHTVGPVWKNGLKNEDGLLANCYINSLHIAYEEKLRSIAFPNISTGIYGFPKRDAAEVAVATVQNFLSSREEEMKVLFVCYDDENFKLYQDLLPESGD